MKAKKVLLILCALILVALSAVSCRKKTVQTTYYTSVDARLALTSSVQLSLRGYAFEEFMNREMIKVSEDRSDETYYGVISGAGDLVLPVSFLRLEMAGDFFVAEGGEETQTSNVYSLSGELLHTENRSIEVTDVGGGYFAIKAEEESHLYSPKGEEVLPGSHLDDTYSYVVCGNFVIAQSSYRDRIFVFHERTSDILLSFYDTSSVSYAVNYVGGSDFIVLINESVDASADYDLEMTRTEGKVYYKQTVRRYTIGVPEPTTLTPGRFLSSIYSKYSVGLTQEERECFALKEGYFAVAYYLREGKKASGALSHYIADGSLNEIKAIPEGVSALLSPINGVAAAVSAAGAILFFNESAEVVGRIDDAVYQNVIFSGEVVTASRVTESGVIRLGGFDRSGRLVLPFEYSYISAFVGGKAIASKGGKSYLVTTSGSETYIGDYSMPHYFDGFYEVKVGESVGATSFDGISLISPVYRAFSAVRRYGSRVYVAISIGAVTDVYRLF